MANSVASKASAAGIDVETLGLLGLSRDPFARRHQPDFLLRSKPVRGALDSIRAALDAEDNIVLVCAPLGAGKTALMDATRREFKDGIRTALIHDAGATWAEIGQQIGKQLRLSGGRLSPGAMTANEGPVFTFRVIINRAERLSVDSLKHLAAYLELDGGSAKRLHKLQLIALANPSEDSRLFDWLESRRYASIELELLDAEQTRRYVARRVQIAQEVSRQLFSSDALERICQLTQGRPGQINSLCAAALTLAASRGSTTVDAEMVGTAARRNEPAPKIAAPLPPPAASLSRPTPTPGVPVVDAASAPVDLFAEVEEEAPAVTSSSEPRVDVIQKDGEERMQSGGMLWPTLCALLLGIIAGGGAFLYLQEPPPALAPITKIVEVPVEVPVEVEVEVEVEKRVEVPVEVVKVVEVPAKPRPPKPRKVVPPAPPAKPAPVVAKKRTLGPVPPAAVVLERAFSKARPGNHTRRVELIHHAETGSKPIRELSLSRLEQRGRTLTLGVVSGEQAGEHRFLSIEKAGQLEDDRFGYRPARGEVEPLRAGKGEDPFAGTSFNYSDFRVRRADQFVLHGIERTRVDERYFYVVSSKPRFKAQYQRVEFVVDALDEVLVEAHFFKGRGLRPYRVVQYPREAMERRGTALVPMRMVSRDFENSRIDEARIVGLALDVVPHRRQFSLTNLQQAGFSLPNQSGS